MSCFAAAAAVPRPVPSRPTVINGYYLRPPAWIAASCMLHETFPRHASQWYKGVIEIDSGRSDGARWKVKRRRHTKRVLYVYKSGS